MVTRQMQIDEIMREFGFHQVHTAMVAMEWQWASLGGVPSVWDLRKTALRLLNTFLDEDPDMLAANRGSTSTGGFEAGRDGEVLYLRFVIDEWAGDDCFEDIGDRYV